MVWDYLTQFWNSITSVGGYTIEFFQNIGNAVAGAVGGMFDFLIHNASDFFIFLGWFFSNIAGLFSRLLIPIKFIFNFLSSFLSEAFSAPSDPAIWSFPASIKDLFGSVPGWDILGTTLGISLLIIFGFYIFNKILEV